MDLGIVHTTLTAVAKLVNEIKTNVTSLYSTKSLSEATKLTRVEPLTILSKDCINLEYMPDVVNVLLSMFSGYYLQAVSMLTKVNDVEVIRILDKLNPDRDESAFLMQESVSRESISHLCMESYQYSLPTRMVPAMEDDNTKHIMEASNLAVGKMLNVEISYTKDGDKEASNVKIPVSVRLLTSVIPNSSIAHMLTYKTDDNGIIERFHAWRAGRIGFIKDLIFCQDLIDEWKRATIGDETGTMQEIIRRVNNSKKYGLLTKNPSLVSASNLFVLTEDIARDIESKLGGKLSNAHVRQKAFDNTYAMIIVVIDREYERVTFYTRGIAASMNLSIKEIKAIGKNKGPDIADIMKAMSGGMSPSF